MKKFDSQKLGLALGTLAPVITFFTIFLVWYPGQKFTAFVEIMWIQQTITKVLSLAVVPNLLIFFIFIWTNKLYSARGTLLSTIIFAATIIIIKFLS
ncbi:MAG: hypothetical protein JW783_12550 [Bacteroidales bacterium]|nr:hypothetical protein [Bacteroidales bacterium]MBN2749255.1 hypothetical protein [Bacteroidales bacterium]